MRKGLPSQVVDAIGDSLLARFESVLDAVNCAAEMQRDLAEGNAELPDHRKMEFCMGISLGGHPIRWVIG